MERRGEICRSSLGHYALTTPIRVLFLLAVLPFGLARGPPNPYIFSPRKGAASIPNSNLSSSVGANIQNLKISADYSSPSRPNDKPLDFHKHKPAVPDPKATLADLELSASDELISKTIDQVTLTASSKCSSSVILKYSPERWWLLRRWHGTILQSSLKKVAINTVITALLSISLRSLCGGTWGWGMEPSSDCLVIARLKAVDKLWHYQMQLTTFILTFFLTQAYQLWREMYKLGRSIQGQLSWVGFLLATHASRDPQTQLTEPAKMLLSTVARQLRLYHLLTWASQTRQFQVLLTTRGMTQLMQRGFLTSNELNTLLQLQLPPTQYSVAVIEWIVLECNQARQHGILDPNNTQFHKLLLQKICELRGTTASISDLTAGRMPLAYAHLVQLLVDSFLFLAPFALYSELGVWSVPCVAFMTLFYEGLLDLAKIFLDPLNNEDYCEGGIDMDLGVFIRESGAGSLRWMQGLAVLPKDMMVPAADEDPDVGGAAAQ